MSLYWFCKKTILLLKDTSTPCRPTEGRTLRKLYLPYAVNRLYVVTIVQCIVLWLLFQASLGDCAQHRRVGVRQAPVWDPGLYRALQNHQRIRTPPAEGARQPAGNPDYCRLVQLVKRLLTICKARIKVEISIFFFFFSLSNSSNHVY